MKSKKKVQQTVIPIPEIGPYELVGDRPTSKGITVAIKAYFKNS